MKRNPNNRLARAGNAGFLLRLTVLSEREATVLDIVRQKGTVCARDVQTVLGHRSIGEPNRLLSCLFEAGLIEYDTVSGRRQYRLTDHGRTVF